jgi:DME family drug/metabolite transporter
VGLVLGLGSAAMFGLGAICSRLGMRGRPHDDGLLMSLAINSLVIAAVLPFVRLPQWKWEGIVGFVVGGVVGTSLGRGASLKAVRRIGAARAQAFIVSAPLYAGIGGWILLGERVSVAQGVGAAVVLVGLVVLIRSRVVAESLVVVPDGSVPAVCPREPRSETTTGFTYGLLSGVFFGLSFAVRKWATVHYPSAVAGAFLGAFASFVVVLASMLIAGRGPAIVRDNFRSIPWWFVAAGVAMSGGLLLQFLAYLVLSAWLVSLLLGTLGIWTLLWSALFIREDERIGMDLVASITLVVIGVGVIALASAG